MKQEVTEDKGNVTLPRKPSHDFFDWKTQGYLPALQNVWLNKIIDDVPGMTQEEFDLFGTMRLEEQEWKNAFLTSLAEDGLIGNPEELTLDETKLIIFMDRKEGNEWQDKLLAKRKYKQSQTTDAAASENSKAGQFHTARWDERTVSMELKMLPAVREASKQIATAHGMTAQEYVEALLVDSLNKNLHEVEEGKKRLERFKGSTVAAKRYAQEEELARLRALKHSNSDAPSR